MSYDIELKDKKTGDVMKLENPFYIRGGTVRAEMDPKTGKLVQAKETDAHINITYNYSSYYYDATKDDERFEGKDDDGNVVNKGIRGLYGVSPRDSIPMLMDMIARITSKYKDEHDNWITGERTRTHFYDENHVEIKDQIGAILHGVPHTKVEETYTVSEGDTNDYWEMTAANAIRPLYDMIHIAADCFTQDCVWDGD